jgi:hypothetical protein
MLIRREFDVSMHDTKSLSMMVILRGDDVKATLRTSSLGILCPAAVLDCYGFQGERSRNGNKAGEVIEVGLLASALFHTCDSLE